MLLAAIYAASQSTLSTGLNSVASSWTLDIQSRISKKEMSFEKQTKIGQYVSLFVGIFAIAVAILLASGGVTSAYEWFNGFMGLVLGILVGIFVLGVFFKSANTFGAFMGFIAASIIMIVIKYQFTDISIWSYSMISIAISLLVGLPCSWLYTKFTHKVLEVLPYTTYADFKKEKASARMEKLVKPAKERRYDFWTNQTQRTTRR